MSETPTRLGSPAGSSTASARRIRLGDGVALGAGVLLPFGFAPFDHWWLAIVSPAALYVCWLSVTPARAAWRGWLYGIGSFGVGVSWIHESFQFSNIGLGVAIPLTAGFVVFLSLYLALAGYVCGRLRGLSALARLALVYPAVWVLTEWLRGWLLSGFTWMQLGYSQLDTVLAGWFPIAGVYGVSFLVALSAAAVAALVCVAAPRLASLEGEGASRSSLLALLAASVLAWAAGAHARSIAWTEAAGPPLRVALAQGNISQDNKWRPEWRQPTLDLYRELTRAHADADLVVWPETALPGTYDIFKIYLRDIARETATSATDVIIGLPMREGEGSLPGGRIYNSVIVLGPEPGFYRKRHLVPFGEFLPLRAVLQPVVNVMGIPVSQFTPGPADQPLPVAAGHPIALAICYEIAFGGEIARALPQARFLVTISNDAWFGRSFGPHQHQQIARARALETGRYLLRSTNTGVTSIVGPDGRTQAELPQFEQGVLTGSITPRKGATPYIGSGDIPLMGALAVLLGVLAWRSWAVE
ncbi:MAG: apolipoprotein N-acyltransferase [Gammaproteobacteria bacterium]